MLHSISDYWVIAQLSEAPWMLMCDSQPLEFLTSPTNEPFLSVPLQWPCHSAITPDAERRSDPGAGRAARGRADAAQWKARHGQTRDRELWQPRGHPPAGPEVAHKAGGLHGFPPSEGGGRCGGCWSGWDICVFSQDTSLLTDGEYQEEGLRRHTRGIIAIQRDPFQCYSVLCRLLWLRISDTTCSDVIVLMFLSILLHFKMKFKPSSHTRNQTWNIHWSCSSDGTNTNGWDNSGRYWNFYQECVIELWII